MKAKDFDKRFDEGENILDHVDLSKAKRITQGQKKGQCGFPHLDDRILR